MGLKKLVLAVVCLSSVSAVQAADIFSTYESVAKRAVSAYKNKESVSQDLTELVSLGYRIMDLYIAKHTECREQFAQVTSEDSRMHTMDFASLEKRYHDGEGLAQAPSHCYLGRSMVVHPYMAMALIREGKPGLEHEVEEVQKRAPKIKARLGL